MSDTISNQTTDQIIELTAPCCVFAISFLRDKVIRYEQEKRHQQTLLQHENYVQTVNSENSRQFRLGNNLLKIETHHEYISYTWYLSDFSPLSEITAFVDSLPKDWLRTFPGQILSRTLLKFEPLQALENVSLHAQQLYPGRQILSGLLERDCARVWTDFAEQASTEQTTEEQAQQGFNVILIEDLGLGPKRAGRACQTILDIEHYRLLTELAAPIAEEIIFTLEEKEQQLAHLIEQVSFLQSPDKQRQLLADLFELSLQSERWRSRTGHRFSATEAYKRILFDRLADFDKVPETGYQSIHHFLSSKMLPMYRTCMSADQRLKIFISRIDRAISLLSAKIRSRSEVQNNQLLSKLEKQNKQQTILQETIETFAIVAISYNIVALLQIFLQSMQSSGRLNNTHHWLLFAVPSSLFISYLMIRYIKHRKMSRMRQMESETNTD